MERSLSKNASRIGFHGCFSGKQSPKLYKSNWYFTRRAISGASVACSISFPEHPEKHNNHNVKVYAVRRRRAYLKSDTYVLIEPGKSEEFISEEELRIRLKGWLENWPGDALPPDLARFSSTDDAVSHLVKSVCELEIDGEVGSVQWYQVQLE